MRWSRRAGRGTPTIWQSVYGLTTSDGVNFKLTTQAGDNIDAYYNAKTQQIDLASVDVQGGYMQLYGDIVSTGGGQLNVLDGYGTVNITNDTSYALVTNMIDTGQGVARRAHHHRHGEHDDDQRPNGAVDHKVHAEERRHL